MRKEKHHGDAAGGAGGRPSSYRTEFAPQAGKLCLLGATDQELADFFDVDERTINRWKQDHPEFCQSIKGGKMQADANVAEKLYQRASGYSHPDTHISNHQGTITVTPVTKHYPPDTTAAIFWLKNRQRNKWRDKQEVEHTGKLTLEDLLDASNEGTANE